MRVKWTGESAKWMMFAVIDESPLGSALTVQMICIGILELLLV